MAERIEVACECGRAYRVRPGEGPSSRRCFHCGAVYQVGGDPGAAEPATQARDPAPRRIEFQVVESDPDDDRGLDADGVESGKMILGGIAAILVGAMCHGLAESVIFFKFFEVSGPAGGVLCCVAGALMIVMGLLTTGGGSG